MRAASLAASLLICACTSSTKSAFREDSVAAISLDAASSRIVQQEVRTGPETITITTDEYGGADQPSSGVSKTLPARGGTEVPRHIVKHTVTVDHRGPVVVDTHSDAQAVSDKRETAKSDVTATAEHKSAPKGIFGSLLGLWPVLLAGGIAAIVYFRKAALAGLVKRLIP